MKNRPKIPFFEKVRNSFIGLSIQVYSILREWDLSDEQVKALSTRLELLSVLLFSQNFFTFFDHAIINFTVYAISCSLGVGLFLIAFILKGFKK